MKKYTGEKVTLTDEEHREVTVFLENEFHIASVTCLIAVFIALTLQFVSTFNLDVNSWVINTAHKVFLVSSAFAAFGGVYVLYVLKATRNWRKGKITIFRSNGKRRVVNRSRAELDRKEYLVIRILAYKIVIREHLMQTQGE